MTLLRLAILSLKQRWRMKAALVLAVATTTTVLTGALLVGDSVSGSLRDLILNRLGRIDQVAISENFFPEDLKDRLESQSGLASSGVVAETAIMVPASLSNPLRDKLVTGVTVFGCRKSFWDLGDGRLASEPQSGEIVLNRRLASRAYLDANWSDRVILQLELPAKIPAESPLGRKTETISRRSFVVSEITANQIADFSLFPSQQGPLNAFVPLEAIAEMLDRPGKANLLLLASDKRTLEDSAEIASFIPQLEDYGLRLSFHSAGPEGSKYFDLTSERMMIQEDVREAALDVWDAEYRPQPVLTYLANWITAGSRRIPYSTVTAIDSVEGGGPLLSPDGKAIELDDDEIVLNRWAADRLQASPGDTIDITYFDPETTHGQVTEHTASFRLHSVAPLFDEQQRATRVNDPHFTPELAGVTDQDSIDDWNPPFPFDASRVGDEDEAYWDAYRATPKAFISLKRGEQLWGSRFGRTTSLRVAMHDANTHHAQTRLRGLLENRLAADGKFAFRDIRSESLRAAGGTTPFGILFLCFSLFLIVSSLLLLILLFRLDLDQAAGEWGLLSGLGFTSRRIVRLVGVQSLVIVASGASIGLLGGIFYANLIVFFGLRGWWLKAVGERFVELHISIESLSIGFFSSFAACLIAILWSFQSQRKASLRWRLLSQGDFLPESRGRAISIWWFGGSALITAIVVIIAVFGTPLIRPPLFFLAGALSLFTGMCLLRQRLGQGDRGHPGVESIYRLTVLNLKRNPQRSVLTISLIATATFLITSVSAFRLSDHDQNDFDLIAESSIPIYFDLGTPEGREELGLTDARSESLLKNVKATSLRVHRGDDASCLNLYRAQHPNLLGVPHDMPQSYHASDLGDASWQVLTRDASPDRSSSPIVPVVIDQNTARYGLGLYGGLGEQFTIDYEGQKITFAVAGLLRNSVFQGSLLVDESQLLRLFPETEGYRSFLIGGIAPGDRPAVSSLLERRLSDFGLDAVGVSDRLRALFAVQNTYLAAFQSLGGLGLLLGTIGLLAVQLRNVFSRRRELALLTVCGFNYRRLALLLVLENTLLLMSGLFLGIISSGLALLPQVLFEGAEIPWLALGQLFLVVLIVGLLVGLWAGRQMRHISPMALLRAE